MKTRIQKKSKSTLQILNSLQEPTQTVDIETRLQAALDHTLNICTLGSENKIHDIEQTGGWVRNIECRYRTFGEYLKLSDNKFSENDTYINRKFDVETRAFKCITSQESKPNITYWYYHVWEVDKLYDNFIPNLVTKTHLNPLMDPMFNVTDATKRLFGIALMSIATRSGFCSRKLALVCKYFWEKPRGIYRITGLCMSELDHAFAGLNLEGDLKNPNTWTSGWILDPWYGEFFPATEFKNKLKDIKKYAQEQVAALKAIGISVPGSDSDEIDIIHWDFNPHTERYPRYQANARIEDYYEIDDLPNETRLQIQNDQKDHVKRFKKCFDSINKLKDHESRVQFFERISLSKKLKEEKVESPPQLALKKSRR